MPFFGFHLGHALCASILSYASIPYAAQFDFTLSPETVDRLSAIDCMWTLITCWASNLGIQSSNSQWAHAGSLREYWLSPGAVKSGWRECTRVGLDVYVGSSLDMPPAWTSTIGILSAPCP